MGIFFCIIRCMRFRILTGNVPGVAQSKNETHEFTGFPKSVLAPENNFDFVFICA